MQNLSSGGMVMTHKSSLKLLNKRGDRWITRVKQQHFLGGDDGLDVFQVYHNGSLSAQHGGRVRELRVKYPKITGG